MSQTGSNFAESVNVWSDITMKILLQRMTVLGFSAESGHLRDSLMNGRLKVSDKGNDQYNISFSFNLYGKFVDMGVGKEISRGNMGIVDTVRQPRPWLSGYWWAQMQRLKEIMREKYENVTSTTILEELEGVTGGAKTMKGFQYAVIQSKRNARNYAKRRSQSGRWTNNHKTWKPY